MRYLIPTNMGINIFWLISVLIYNFPVVSTLKNPTFVRFLWNYGEIAFPFGENISFRLNLQDLLQYWQFVCQFIDMFICCLFLLLMTS